MDSPTFNPEYLVLARRILACAAVPGSVRLLICERRDKPGEYVELLGVSLPLRDGTFMAPVAVIADPITLCKTFLPPIHQCDVHSACVDEDYTKKHPDEVGERVPEREFKLTSDN